METLNELLQEKLIDVDIDRSHHIEKLKKGKQSRPIIIKFARYNIRNRIFKNKTLVLYLFICFYVNSFISSFICFLFILLLLFHIVKSAIPHFPVSETVQLLQNDTQKYMLLRLMYYLGTTKRRLGKGTTLGWGLLLRFIIVIYKKFLYFVVCCSFNGKMK